jgi:4,5-dihydroxyphthalate decarboxylase
MAGIHLAARNWDHILPIALGDLPGTQPATLERREITPDLWTEPGLDGGETSFSRYIRARAAGDYSVTALPVFIMRGFRHRCIITRQDSPLETASDLRNLRIGLTGWADTGNTWTRAILRADGVGIHDAEWRVGRLTGAHPVQDRIGPIDVPSNVKPCANEEPMVDMLQRGALDAVMTPFMPPGFSAAGSPLRTLYRNNRETEAQYYERTGYVPGIHLLAVQSRVLEEQPEAAQLLVDLFEDSRVLSDQRRAKLLDITPWQNEAYTETQRTFGSDWMASGWTRNFAMISDLQTEMVAQGLIQEPVPSDILFPHQLEPASVLA